MSQAASELFDPDYRTHVKTLVGTSVHSESDYSVDRLLARIRAGIEVSLVVRMAHRYDMANALLADLLAISPSTLKRRRAANGRLTADESDRFVRVAGLYAMAEDVLGSPALAAEWMSRANRSLGQESPNAYARMDAGAREVEDLLGRIAHGVAA